MVIILDTVLPVFSVLIIDRENWISGIREAIVVVPLVAGQVGAGLHPEIVINLVLDGEVAAVFLVIVLDVHTVVAVVVGGGKEGGSVIAALYLDCRVVRYRNIAEHDVVPSGVGGPSGLEFLDGRIVHTVGIHGTDIGRGQAGIDVGLIGDHCHQHRVPPEIELRGELGQCRLLTHNNLRIVLLRLSCSDEDDAVCTSGTVNRRSGSIFQNLHRHNVLRVDLLQVTGITVRETVNDHERGIGSVQ